MDISEKTDLANSMPEKLAELARLHYAWLAEMPKPVKAGEKKWLPGMESGKKKKLTQEQKKKARDEERAKKKAANN